MLTSVFDVHLSDRGGHDVHERSHNDVFRDAVLATIASTRTVARQSDVRPAPHEQKVASAPPCMIWWFTVLQAVYLRLWTRTSAPTAQGLY